MIMTKPTTEPTVAIILLVLLIPAHQKKKEAVRAKKLLLHRVADAEYSVM